MAGSILEKGLSKLSAVFGTANERQIKKILPILDKVGTLEPRYKEMTDEEMPAETQRFRERLVAGETLDDILPEAFALVREAGRRFLNMRHFDVQIIGGVVLHQGEIAEMKTGEGKTLVATLPAYLNALTGEGVHIITVNDYLAQRDAAWMGRIYKGLGLTVGAIQHDMDDEDRRAVYGSDITFGTNNEFGFDYLRDNMKFEEGGFVQRKLKFGIVDEVDSILIDEARTPLIISGPAEEATRLYGQINGLIKPLLIEGDEEEEPASPDDYVEGGKDNISKENYEYLIVDEKSKTVNLKEKGVVECERLLRRTGELENDVSLFDMRSITLLHHVEQALKAYVLFEKDVDYVVKDDEVIIVDEFTGRLMSGRRYSDGLHQALEAKERVKVQEENVTLATITFQNYFRLYEKLAGMTGTADTEASEFQEIYKLPVVVIPTNVELIRHEYPDQVYKTEREKINAVIDEIRECQEEGRPVLVGTTNIEKSEKLASILRSRKIPHNVLNAKNHMKEAEIIAQTGRKGALTISTNMAGRGTDILLGGNPEFLASAKTNSKEGPEYEEALEKFRARCEEEHKEVVEMGGLHVIATERHESRRIDNQLRGRSGRQGDPGSSRFYLSLEDDLLRIFGSNRISGIMDKLGMEEGVPIEAKMVTRAIENAQKRVEAHHFEMRKQILKYDDVMNKHREIVYDLRKSILDGSDLSEQIAGIASDILDGLFDVYMPESEHFEDWNLEGFLGAIHRQYGLSGRLDGRKIVYSAPSCEIDIEDETRDLVADKMHRLIEEVYRARYRDFDDEMIREFERVVYLQIIDAQWKDHLTNMDHVKEGVGLRGYAQVDPLNEYKREAFEMFESLNERIDSETLLYLYKLDVRDEGIQLEDYEREQEFYMTHNEVDAFGGSEAEAAVKTAAPVRRETPKVGRNQPCPCGSGKKYKHCCGR
ncbi:MAG: preprotein translocase subunit SecA [Nitrospinota bacterium]|nr:preprotein translocase subunit SecA [Nitrospinota bacterium]